MENQFAESHLIDYSRYVYIICHTEEEGKDEEKNQYVIAGRCTHT